MGLTPPDIPVPFIEERAPELYRLIQNIEKQGNYKVVVKDASLGCQLPVVCVLLIDRDTQRYMVNFGAHPCFPVALERCLTEMFQFYETGKTETRRKKMAPFVEPVPEILNGICNWVSLLKDDVGFIPYSFFAGAPSWAFEGWADQQEYSNASGLQQQIRTLLELSGDIYIRSNSYFPFFAYRVYIPGISTTKLPFDEKQLESYRLSSRLSEMLINREPLSSADREQLRTLIFSPDTFAGALVFHNMDEETRYTLYAALLMDSGETSRAIRILKMLESKSCRCALRAIELQSGGMTQADIRKMLDLFYSPEDCAFALCWLGPNVFDLLAELRIGHPGPSEDEGSLESTENSVDILHQHLKKHMLEHSLDQFELDRVIYPV